MAAAQTVIGTSLLRERLLLGPPSLSGLAGDLPPLFRGKLGSTSLTALVGTKFREGDSVRVLSFSHVPILCLLV
jgi:hypothetical protein